jgi:hypothetical protein
MELLVIYTLALLALMAPLDITRMHWSQSRQFQKDSSTAQRLTSMCLLLAAIVSSILFILIRALILRSPQGFTRAFWVSMPLALKAPTCFHHVLWRLQIMSHIACASSSEGSSVVRLLTLHDFLQCRRCQC